jgi:hypothetical protein
MWMTVTFMLSKSMSDKAVKRTLSKDEEFYETRQNAWAAAAHRVRLRHFADG